MASHLLKYAVLGTSLQPPMSELEVIEAVTSSYTGTEIVRYIKYKDNTGCFECTK